VPNVLSSEVRVGGLFVTTNLVSQLAFWGRSRSPGGKAFIYVGRTDRFIRRRRIQPEASAPTTFHRIAPARNAARLDAWLRLSRQPRGARDRRLEADPPRS
jgi:hypothetical protein